MKNGSTHMKKDPLKSDNDKGGSGNRLEGLADGILSFPIRRPLTSIFYVLVITAILVRYASQYWQMQEKGSSPMAAITRGRHYDTMSRMMEQFPELMEYKHDAILLSCDGCDFRGSKKFEFFMALVAIQNALTSVKAHNPDCADFHWPSVDSSHGDAAGMLEKLISRDGSAAVIPTALKAMPILMETNRCLMQKRGVVAQIEALDKLYGGIRITMPTTNILIQKSMRIAVRNTLFEAGWSAPIMTLIMVPFTGNLYRAIVPLLCCIGAILGHLAMSVIIKKFWADFAMPLPDTCAVFIELALALDYGLLFWRRFSQERRLNPRTEAYPAALIKTVSTSGKVIMTSMGAIVSTCFTCCFYPLMNSQGLLAYILQISFGVLFVGCYSLILPVIFAMLLPSLFDEWLEEGRAPWWKMGSPPLLEYINTTVGIWADKLFLFLGNLATNKWFKWIIPIVICGCLMPFIIELKNAKLYGSRLFGILFVKSLPEYQTKMVLDSQFGIGALEPMFSMISADSLGPIASLSDEQFSALQVWYKHSNPEMATEVLPPNQTDLLSLSGALDLGFKRQPVDPTDVIYSDQFRSFACKYVESMVNTSRGKPYGLDAHAIDMLWWDPGSGSCTLTPRPGRENMIAKGTVLMALRPNTDMYGKHIDELVSDLQTLDDKTPSTLAVDGSRFHFQVRQASMQAVSHDVVQKWQDASKIIFPLQAIISLSVVGLVFGSLGLPLKLGVTVVLPIAADIGLLFMIWDDKGGVPFTTLFLSTGFLFALAVDYDIFLYSRMYERRMDGFDNNSALALAMVETGNLINVAGFLMCLAFFPLCISKSEWIQQHGYFYIIAVAIDTLIIRTLVAPCVLTISEKFNFWPSKPPTPTKHFMSP